MMLDYEWGNTSSSSAMLSADDEPAQDSDHYPGSINETLVNHTGLPHHHHHFLQPDSSMIHTHFQFHSAYDPTSYSSICPTPSPPQAALLSVEPLASANPAQQPGFLMVPKTEPVGVDLGTAGRIGLNLGRRTYFSSTEDDLVNRLYRRSRAFDTGSLNRPRCQAEGCDADLTHAKHYHRRHKVCESHSKAATVIAGGLTQRFCQQCSRFHLLSEFDNAKRSCRKRLADHNRRRRKSHQQNQECASKSQLGHASSSETPTSSPRNPGNHSSLASVTVAISPSKISPDYFQQRLPF